MNHIANPDGKRMTAPSACEENRNLREIMQELANLASMSAVRWEWLEEYAEGHPVCYPTDFIAEAKEMLRRERSETKG